MSGPNILICRVCQSFGSLSVDRSTAQETAQLQQQIGAMRNNLIKAHELICNIEANFTNSKKLRQLCTELEDLLEYIEPDTTVYHYMIFLVEIYATKLRDFSTAETLCKKVMQDPRLSVQLEGLLRYSFIKALDHKYNLASQALEQASTLAQKKPQLNLIFINYYQRLFAHSKQSNLLLGLKYESLQKYNEAMQSYMNEFENGEMEMQIEGKYFAAKSILQLIGIFPNLFQRFDPSIYKNYLQEIYQEKEERDDMAAIKRIDQNYIAQKMYLNKIIELLQKKQLELRSTRNPTSKNSKTNNEFFERKMLAMMKILKVLKTETNLNSIVKKEFENCLNELRGNSMNNFNMLSQFTAKQMKIASRGSDIIKIYSERLCFDEIKSLYLASGDNLNMKEKPLKKNRFSNLNSFETESPLKFGKTLKGDESMSKQFNILPAHSEETQFIDINKFEGSYMEKIHETSEGSEKRYFHFNKNELDKGKFKLYYCKKQNQSSKDNDYYDLKNYNGIIEGKQTKALKRKQSNNFEESQCFSILLQDNKSRNFYVPNKSDYQKWIQLFRKYEYDLKYNNSKSKASKVSQNQSSPNMNVSMRKTKPVQML